MTNKQRIKMLESNLNSSLEKLRQGLITQEQYNILAKDAHKRIKELKEK
jgi:hypothetical protein